MPEKDPKLVCILDSRRIFNTFIKKVLVKNIKFFFAQVLGQRNMVKKDERKNIKSNFKVMVILAPIFRAHKQTDLGWTNWAS